MEVDARTKFLSVRSAPSDLFSSAVVPGIISMVAASVMDGVSLLKVMGRGVIPGPDTQVMTVPKLRGSTSSTLVPSSSSPSISWALLVEKYTSSGLVDIVVIVCVLYNFVK